jgi:hypothetical protein
LDEVAQLILRFRAAATEKGDLATPPERDQALHAEMKEAILQLREVGDAGEAALRSLLLDQSPRVRSWVAAEFLSRGDHDAIAVLEGLTQERGMIGFNARMTLKEYRAGRLRSPFGWPQSYFLHRCHPRTRKPRRGELIERSFAHTLETGGMRRTHLRGHEKIAKPLLIHVAGFNLGLLMRQRFGIGKPRCLQGEGAGLWAAIATVFHVFVVVIHAIAAVLRMATGPRTQECRRPAVASAL